MYSECEKRGVVVVRIFLSASILFLFLLINAGSAAAFGISTPYLENNTLKVAAGNEYTYTLTLQNGDEEGYYVDILYSSTDDIAKLENITHYIQSKTYDNKVDFLIDIPADAPAGTEYKLEYSARPRSSSNETVTFGVELKRDVEILVTETSAAVTAPEGKKSILSIPDDARKTTRNIGKYLLGALGIAILIFVIIQIWNISRRMAARISSKKKTKYSISEAISLAEVRTLLEKITDEEFELIEIRKLFKSKLAELTNNDIVDAIETISRREAIFALNRILK